MAGMHNDYSHISFQPRWTLTKDIIYTLGKCEAIIKAISGTPIRPDYRQRLLQVSLIKGAQASTAIEGNTLTFEEIEEIQQGKNLPPGREYLQKEVTNIIEALNTILLQVIEKKEIQTINPGMICDYHYLIGKDIGDNFNAIPGKLRANKVTVANYRAPQPETVDKYLSDFCEWIKREFHFEQGQNFIETIIQAMVTHIYIAWIHPFSDGNGRTARLLEFYLLIRAGVPDIASHVLSNYYNHTRTEYYRQIAEATRKNDLTDFIAYGVNGFLDGLENILAVIQENQLVITWENYIYDYFADKKAIGKAVQANKNKRTILLRMPHNKYLTLDELKKCDTEIAVIAQKVNPRSFIRYMDELVKINLVDKTKEGYRAKTEILSKYLAVGVR